MLKADADACDLDQKNPVRVNLCRAEFVLGCYSDFPSGVDMGIYDRGLQIAAECGYVPGSIRSAVASHIERADTVAAFDQGWQNGLPAIQICA